MALGKKEVIFTGSPLCQMRLFLWTRLIQIPEQVIQHTSWPQCDLALLVSFSPYSAECPFVGLDRRDAMRTTETVIPVSKSTREIRSIACGNASAVSPLASVVGWSARTVQTLPVGGSEGGRLRSKEKNACSRSASFLPDGPASCKRPAPSEHRFQ